MRKAIVLGALAIVGLGATAAFVRQDASFQEQSAGLVERAAVKPDQARAKALAAVPGGKITEFELEEEDGRLIYSFELTVAGQDGVTEVEIDAATGEVLASSQDADDEQNEDEDDDDDEGAKTAR